MDVLLFCLSSFALAQQCPAPFSEYYSAPFVGCQPTTTALSKALASHGEAKLSNAELSSMQAGIQTAHGCGEICAR